MAQTKEYSVGDSLVMIPNLGRSSSVSFPYFNVKTPEGGMVFAIGWTGSWKAEIIRPEQDCFRVSTGLKNLNTYLLPGEEIRTPLTAMIPWQGEDRMDGQEHPQAVHHEASLSESRGLSCGAADVQQLQLWRSFSLQ